MALAAPETCVRCSKSIGPKQKVYLLHDQILCYRCHLAAQKEQKATKPKAKASTLAARRFAAFDLEIAKDIPDDGSHWTTVAPLGITCAAIAIDTDESPKVWHGVPQLTPTQAGEVVTYLRKIVADGYTLLTWNGCGFDFAVLAQESGLTHECSELALNHIDLMLIVTCHRGWHLSLQKALEGARLKGKRHVVTLRNGSTLTDMAGIKAPQLWRSGEYDAVLSYLRDDTTQLIELARVIQQRRAIEWTSNGGRPQYVAVSEFLNVRSCLRLPEPDTSWMSDPPSRSDFVQWIPDYHRLLPDPALRPTGRTRDASKPLREPLSVVIRLDSSQSSGAAKKPSGCAMLLFLLMAVICAWRFAAFL